MMRIYFLLIASLLPSLAMADTSLMPAGSDVTVKYFLNSLFGSLVNIGGGLDPMAEVIAKFNAFVLLVGGVLLAYGLVAGTMQTAHDGEVLGKRWSSMWVPIRTSIGIAAIIPLGSGYAAVQYVVMWLALQGVGAANLVWETYASRSSSLAQVSVFSNKEKGAEIATTVLKQELCVAILNAELQAARQPDGTNYAADAYGRVQVRQVDGTNTSNGFESRACGSYHIPPQTASNNSTLQSWFGSTFDQVTFGQQIGAAHASAFRTLQTSMQVLAQKVCGERCGVVPESNDAIAAQFGTSVDAYNASIANAVASATGGLSQTNDVGRNATRDGWGMAGAWYMKYVYVQNELSKEATKFPTVAEPSGAHIPYQFKDAWSAYQSRSNSITALVKYKDELGIQRQLREESEGESDSVSSFITNKISHNINAAQTLGKGMFADKNPLLAAKDFGDYVFTGTVAANMGAAALAFKAALVADTKVAGTGPGGGAAITSSLLIFAPLIFLLFGGLMTFAGMLAFYLPVLPFILWFGVVVGWLVLVVEAIIAAPLWAIMHVHPDGDGIAGKSGQGYSLVMALMLRPVLAILGLVAAMVLLDPVGRLFAQTFWSAFDLAQGNSLQGIFAFLAALCIFTAIFVSLIQRVFSLIHIIPDQILKWIGGPSSELGQSAQQLGQAGLGNAMAVGGVIGGVGGQAISTSQNFRQLREQRLSKEAQEKGNAIAKQNSIAEGEQQYGRGMGAARMAGSDAVRAAYDGNWEQVQRLAGDDAATAAKAASTSENGLDEATLERVRESATANAYDRIHGGAGSGAYQARTDFNDARSKYGLGEASAAEHNKFMKDRERVEMRDKGSFSAETYVQNMLGRQSSSRGASAPPVQPTTKPDGVSGDAIE